MVRPKRKEASVKVFYSHHNKSQHNRSKLKNDNKNQSVHGGDTKGIKPERNWKQQLITK